MGDGRRLSTHSSINLEICFKVMQLQKVCPCCLDIGLQVLIGLISAFRLAGVICSGFYGPWFYLVLTLGVVYIGGDFLLFYSLFWKTDGGKPSCDFTDQKVWILIWQVLNAIGVLGLAVALGWYLQHLGLDAMLYEPVHFVVFIIILLILPLIICTSILLLGLYNYLKEAYIDEILGRGGEDDADPGLTQGGRRISI